MNGPLDVVIVGAGPYGLSLAAHLREAGVRFRIFGKPMSTWKEHMPAGMFLKSDGFASNLSDPADEFPLKQFCAQEGEPYDDRLRPVRLETFCAYGLSFQRRLVPSLEERWVTAIDKAPEGFQVKLDDGEVLTTAKVVLAVGITHFDYVPPSLKQLPPELVSHSSQYGDTKRLRGQSALVVGGGSSACDLAAALAAGGADVTIAARSPVMKFSDPPSSNPSLWQRVRRPSSGIGPSIRSRIYADAPWLVHALPQRLRSRIVRRHLGPMASWTVKDRVLGRIPIWLGCTVQAAEPLDGKVRITLRDLNGVEKSHVTDHVIAATGYRVDVNRLEFLSQRLRSGLRMVDTAPILSLRFESSVPGLFFMGLASAPSFGPVMRFSFGSDYAARTLARHLTDAAKSARPAGRPGPEYE